MLPKEDSMRRAINITITALSVICTFLTLFLILFADILLKDNTVYTYITTTTESIEMSFETDPLVLDGSDISLMQGVRAVSESGNNVLELVSASVVNENNKKVVVYSVNDPRYNLQSFKRGLQLNNYRGPSISVKNVPYTCDINNIEEYIFKCIDAKYIIARDGYGNDISENIYVDPSVEITKSGRQKVTLAVKNAFADMAKKNVTISITGELVNENEITLATEKTTVRRTRASSPEDSTFSVISNTEPEDQVPTAPTEYEYLTIPIGPARPPYMPQKPQVKPTEKPTAPTQAPTATSPATEPDTEAITEPTTEPVTEPVTQPITEPVTEQPTAVIYFADDNEREPLSVNVGDTFEYDVYVKLTDPQVQSFALWTYFNQPVGTKQEPNQEGNAVMLGEDKVLSIAEDGYTPYYSPFREEYDLMKSDSYLVGFGTGALDENDKYQMITTSNGEFTQIGGCLVSTVTFKVEQEGKVEIFTRLDEATVDLNDTEKKADYVAIYNEKLTVEPTQPTEPATEPTTEPATEPITDDVTAPTEVSSEPATEAPTAIIHFVDDNEQEPLTVSVGDTITYDVSLKLDSPIAQSFTTWTYFNQPVGTKQTANQVGKLSVGKENQVLKVAKDGYKAYYTPFREKYDSMRFSNYLVAFGMSDTNENDLKALLQTQNGTFTQKDGCHIASITFTVQKAGEVEVFTRLESAMRDNNKGIKAKYVAVNSKAYKPVEVLPEEETATEEELENLTHMQRSLLNVEDTPSQSVATNVAHDVDEDGAYTLTDVILASRGILCLECLNKQ